jgi:hypothetical protein
VKEPSEKHEQKASKTTLNPGDKLERGRNWKEYKYLNFKTSMPLTQNESFRMVNGQVISIGF